MITFKFRCVVIVVFFILATLVSAIFSATIPFSAPRKGKIDGVTLWTLPRTSNGLQPIQSWHNAGSSPDGDIYVAGMDHLTNAALYRVHNDTLRYVGDAKTASQAANNWKSDEYAEKFHTRPVYMNGKMYVAVLNRSYFNNEYLTTYPGKWYTYDIAKQTFTDISASQPGGITVARCGFVTLAADYKLNIIYGALVPTGGLVRYDVSANKFTDLGRPSAITQQFVYINRFMWVDSRSRLYFTGGGWSQPDPPNVFKHVHYYDPTTSSFGDMNDWALAITQAIELGQWNRMHTRAYMVDDHGNIYRFDDAGPSWTFLSSVGSSIHGGSVWVFHLSADEKKAYIGTGLGAPEVLLEYDIATKSARQLCQMSDLDKPFGDANRHTGYDAWDPEGRFCLTGFKGLPNEYPPADSVIFARIDPVRLKVAKGLLPALVEASADTIRQTGNRGFMVSRTGGSMANAQEILFTVKAVNNQNEAIFTYNSAITIPAGSSNTPVPLSSLSFPDSLKTNQLQFAVVPNGNDYVAGMNKTASLGLSTAVRQRPFLKGEISTFKMTFIRNTAVYFEFNDFQEKNVPIIIMDIHGAVIKKIASGPASNGTYRTSWDLTGFNGQRVIPGMYFAYCRNVRIHRQIIIMQ
jgi:hypothetical protein